MRTASRRSVALRTAPLLKWPGGKTRELPAILDALPDDVDRLLDPFVGGGALLFALPATLPAAVNDASADLVDLYRRVQVADGRFLALADELAAWWDAIAEVVAAGGHGLVEVFTGRPSSEPPAIVTAARSAGDVLAGEIVGGVPPGWGDLVEPLGRHLADVVPTKLGRMRQVERRRGHRLPVGDVWRNVEGAVRAAAYTAIRSSYNAARRGGDVSPAQAARFLFLREYAYAAMFRFNRQGEFNVPYGGITYNRKAFATRVAHLRSAPVVDRLARTALHCGDFADFLARVEPRPGDLVFLDPPYDSDFSEYDRTPFGPGDHRRLAATIRSLPCRFQLVIRDTPLVRELYLDPAWHVRAFDLTYGWTIKERNDRAATHLLITDVRPEAVPAAG